VRLLPFCRNALCYLNAMTNSKSAAACISSIAPGALTA
jgi:hypothetical protein